MHQPGMESPPPVSAVTSAPVAAKVIAVKAPSITLSLPSALPPSLASAARDAAQQLSGSDWQGWFSSSHVAAMHQSAATSSTAAAVVASPAPTASRFWHPVPELQPQASDALVSGQTLPLRWLLDEVRQMASTSIRSHAVADLDDDVHCQPGASPAASAAPQQPQLRQPQLTPAQLQRTNELLCELHGMASVAPTHFANLLSLEDYCAVFAAITHALECAAMQTPSAGDLSVLILSLQRQPFNFLQLLMVQAEAILPPELQLPLGALCESPELRAGKAELAATQPMACIPMLQIQDIVHVCQAEEPREAAALFAAKSALRTLERASEAAASAAARVDPARLLHAETPSLDELMMGASQTLRVGDTDSRVVLLLLDRLKRSAVERFSAAQLQRWQEDGTVADEVYLQLCSEATRLLSRLRAVLESGACVDERHLSRALSQHVLFFRCWSLASPLLRLFIAQVDVEWRESRRLNTPAPRRISLGVLRAAARAMALDGGAEHAVHEIKGLYRQTVSRRHCGMHATMVKELSALAEEAHITKLARTMPAHEAAAPSAHDLEDVFNQQ